MRKNISVFFICFAFILCVSFMFCFRIEKAYAKEVDVLDCKSDCAYLCDAQSKSVIYSVNENKKMPIASMCKVMTLLLCFDEIENGNINLEDDVCVSETAQGMGGSQVFLEAGANYKCSELLKGIVVSSANDACVAMAEKISGSEDAFVLRMNEKCLELDMQNTHFVNCTGLPKSGQFSCAKDVSVMFSELIKNEKYFEFSKIWMDKIEHPNNRYTEISNTNKLIRFYQGCDSGKTGYTSEAGHCLVASAKRGDMRLISVVIKAPDSKSRFNDVSSMFNYGFNNYTNKVIVDSSKPYDIEVNVKFGKRDKVKIVAEKDVCIFTKKGEKLALDFDLIEKSSVCAPIKKGEVVATINVYNNGVLMDSVNMLSVEDIDEKSYFDVIENIAKNWAI